MSVSVPRYVPKAWKDALPRECVKCGSTRGIEYHHIVPLALGGENILDNIEPLCRACHTAIHYTEFDRGELIRNGRDQSTLSLSNRIHQYVEKGMTDYEIIVLLDIKPSRYFTCKTLYDPINSDVLVPINKLNRQPNRTGVGNAKKLISEKFGSNDRVLMSDIAQEAKRLGISDATLYRARREMGLRSIGKGKPPHRTVWWVRPTT